MRALLTPGTTASAVSTVVVVDGRLVACRVVGRLGCSFRLGELTLLGCDGSAVVTVVEVGVDCLPADTTAFVGVLGT